MSTAAECSAKASANASTFPGAIESPSGGAMAAPPSQQVRAGGERAVQVEGGDGAARADPVLIRVPAGDQHDRTAEALDEPRRDDADHPAVPVLPGDHVAEAPALRLRPLLDLADRIPQDALFDRLAIAVQRLELVRQPPRLRLIRCQQEVQRGAGVSEPAGCVDPGRQPERDRARVDRGGVDAAHAHERLEARLVGSREPSHAGRHEGAVLVEEGNDVGDRRQGDEVEMPLETVNAERLEELQHHSRPAKLGE